MNELIEKLKDFIAVNHSSVGVDLSHISKDETLMEMLKMIEDYEKENKHTMSLEEQVKAIKELIETKYFVEAYAALDDLVEEFKN